MKVPINRPYSEKIPNVPITPQSMMSDESILPFRQSATFNEPPALGYEGLRSMMKDLDDLGIDIPIHSNNHDDMNNQTNDSDLKRLPVGLVDYIVIVGTTDDQITCPVHENFISSIDNPQQPQSTSTTTDASISTPISPTILKASDCCIWDRFPKQDYHDNPLPNKIEWFISPTGHQTVCSTIR